MSSCWNLASAGASASFVDETVEDVVEFDGQLEAGVNDGFY